MAKHMLSISEVQDEITYLPEQFDEDPEAVIITMHGKPVMAILPFHTYQSLLAKLETALDRLESLEETLEIIQDEEQMVAFREGVEALEKGDTVAWEEVQGEPGH